MTGGANHSRPTTITHPNGRVLGHGYASGLDIVDRRTETASHVACTYSHIEYI